MISMIPYGNIIVQNGKRSLVWHGVVSPITDMHTLQRNGQSDFSIVLPETGDVRYHTVFKFGEVYMIATQVTRNEVERTMTVNGMDLVTEMLSHITVKPNAGIYDVYDVLSMIESSGLTDMINVSFRMFVDTSGATVSLDGDSITCDELLRKMLSAFPTLYFEYTMEQLDDSVAVVFLGAGGDRKFISSYAFVSGTFSVSDGKFQSPLYRITEDDRIYQNFDYVPSPLVEVNNVDPKVAKRETDLDAVKSRLGVSSVTTKTTTTKDNTYCYFGASNIADVSKIDKTYTSRISSGSPTKNIPVINAAQFNALKRQYPSAELIDNTTDGTYAVSAKNVVVATQIGSSSNAAKKANLMLTDAAWLGDLWTNVSAVKPGRTASGRVSVETYNAIEFSFNSVFTISTRQLPLMMMLDTVSFNYAADNAEINLTFSDAGYIRSDNVRVVFLNPEGKEPERITDPYEQLVFDADLDAHGGVYPRQFKFTVPIGKRIYAFLHARGGKALNDAYEFSFVGDAGECDILPASHDGDFDGVATGHVYNMFADESEIHRIEHDVDGLSKQYVLAGYAYTEGTYNVAYHGFCFENNTSTPQTVWFSVPQLKYGNNVSIYTGEGGTPYDYGALKVAY